VSSGEERDPFRPVLAVALFGTLLGLSLWVLRPFVPAFIWATMIVVATWPLMLAAQRRLGGRRLPAVLVMTLSLLLVFVIPLSLAIGTIVSNAGVITEWAKSLESGAAGPAPAWVAGMPLVGDRAVGLWDRYIADGEVRSRLAPYMRGFVTWFLTQVGSFGAVTLQFLLTVVFAAVLYARGEAARRGTLAFARRVSPKQGEASVQLAGQAIRGVAMGVVVTAVVQSLAGGLGLFVAGVPLAGMLTAAMVLLAVAQIGAVPVLACAVIWLYARDDNAWGTALLVWTVIVGTMDNVLRPILIRRGADLPLLLIFTGVVGGLVAFGLVGLFIGPMVLAVTWKLCIAWVRDGGEAAEALQELGALGVATGQCEPPASGGGDIDSSTPRSSASP
jgi:predicted PurR-regulated permease PerM